MRGVLQIIQMMHNEMRDLTLESGVSVEKYERVLEHASEASDEDIRELERWLRDLYDGVYSLAYKVKSRHSNATWDRFKSYGFTTLAEVVLLKQTLRDLKHKWRKPYYVRHRKTTTKRSKPLHLQSEQAEELS